MCQKVLAILQNPEATLAELKFAREFIRDNRIEALPIPGSPMGEVKKAADDRILKLPTTFDDGSLLDPDDPAIAHNG